MVRQKDGSVRAFYNVCTHRGSRLREEASGSEHNVFACPYHAWCFGLDGELVGTSAPFNGIEYNLDSDGPLYIGAGPNDHFLGRLSDVKIDQPEK